MMRPKPKFVITVSGALLIAYVALASAATRQAQRVTAAGTDFADLVRGDTALVVVYDPATCFKCDNLMPRLAEWGRRHPEQLAIVLTRQAMSEERDQMALLRIQPAGVVRGDLLSRLVGRRFEPEVILYVNDVERKSERYDAPLSQRTAIMTYVIEGTMLEGAHSGMPQQDE